MTKLTPGSHRRPLAVRVVFGAGERHGEESPLAPWQLRPRLRGDRSVSDHGLDPDPLPAGRRLPAESTPIAWRERFLQTLGPGLFAGVTFGDWMALLRENRFAIDPPYWLRA